MSESEDVDLAAGVDALFSGKIVLKWVLVVDLLDPAEEGRQLAAASSPNAASWDSIGLLNAALERELFVPDDEYDIDIDEDD